MPLYEYRCEDCGNEFEEMLHFSEREDPGELIMDSNPLEKEKGITILAKNTSINFMIF